MTVEELVAMGYDRKVAEALLKTSGTQAGASLPFPVLKINYDLKDILSDEGVKKGEFITGWEVDNNTLTVKAKGKVLKQPLKVIFLASVYQNSHYSTDTHKIDAITDIFFSPYDSPKMVDNKSGKTVKELKDSGVRMQFNNILLMLVQEGKEWKPYIFYSHGTHYYNWQESLSAAGIPDENVILNTVFEIKTKKVPTQYNPAWVFDIKSTKELSMEERIKMIPIISPISKTFNEYIEKYNSSKGNVGSDAVDNNSSGISVDEDEVDIDFDE